MAAAAAVGLGASLALAAPAAATVTIGDGFVRVFGDNRYETAVAIANNLPGAGDCAGDSDVAIVASGQNYPDALAGALASDFGGDVAPILLTQQDALHPATETYLEDCPVDEVLILGETAAVSADVEDDIEDIVGAGNVLRWGGDNRYETAVQIAEEYLDVFGQFEGLFNGDDYEEVVFLATGQQYADALSAGPQAFKGHGILLTKSNELPMVTEDFLDDWVGDAYDAEDQAVVILGQTSAVSQGVEDAVQDLDEDLNVLRVGGANRYATAASLWTLLDDEFGDVEIENVGLASGQVFPDALAAAPYLGVVNAPLVLMQQNALPDATEDYLNDASPDVDLLHVFGGTDAISNSAVASAADAAGTS